MTMRHGLPYGDNLTTLTEFLRGTLDDPSDFEVQGCLLALMEWCDQVATACHKSGAQETARIFRDIAEQMDDEAAKLSVRDLDEDDDDYDN